MRFRTEIVPWINEIKSYIKGDTNKIGPLKKILREVDFEQLDYATKAKLTNLFDPRCEITEEVFKRELNLYFSLLEDKKPINIPIFSEYIEWIYSQDMSTMSDRVFEMISSRLSKSTAENLPEKIGSFMTRLPEEYKKGIDRMSNARMSTLINILKDTGIKYADMPEECKGFIRDMFRACAVKTEISENNKNRFRGLFKDDPRNYYSLLNKAFAGVGAYDSWIDEPAKKITYLRMVDYANFQNVVLNNLRYRLDYSLFDSCARALHLPVFPELESMDSKKFYLSEPREYKDYAKKMGNLFVEMVRDEVASMGKEFNSGEIKAHKIYDFAPTTKMRDDARRLFCGSYSNAQELMQVYSKFLVELVHLDELTGQSSYDIFRGEVSKASVQTETKAPVETLVEEIKTPVETLVEETKTPTLSEEIDEELGYDLNEQSYLHELDLRERILNRSCIPEDLSLLYEMYEELLAEGGNVYDIEQAILDLECRIDDEDLEDALNKD